MGVAGYSRIDKPALMRLCLFQESSGKQVWERGKLNQKSQTIIEYLAFLSAKHRISLSELFQTIVSAREQVTATYENLIVEYRGSLGKEAIFLITKDEKVVVQFRAAEELLQRKDIRFENWMDTDRIRRQISKQNPVPTHPTLVQDLRHGMKKVNVEAKVLETLEPQLVHTQYGNSATVTNAWIADETGKIKLCLWNEQASAVNVGDIIQIKNALVATFKGERQLRLGKTGTVSVLQNRAANPKQQPNAITKNTICA